MLQHMQMKQHNTSTKRKIKNHLIISINAEKESEKDTIPIHDEHSEKKGWKEPFSR